VERPLACVVPRPGVTLDGGALNPGEMELRRATVTGEFDSANEVVLRNRTYNEIPGVHVLTPLRIAGSDAAILVDRGWIPYEQATPGARAAFAPAEGPVTVQGVLRKTQERRGSLMPVDAAPAGGGRLDAWHRVEIPLIQAQTPYPLLPLFLEEERASPAVAASGFPRPDPDIALDEGPHLFYALQWFAFAVIAAGGYFILYRSRAG
jgi:surfeit locus 1 family protein